MKDIYSSPATLTKEDIVRALTDNDPAPTGALFAAADRARAENVGGAVHLRALIEFSNRCRNNCLYCGIRAGNANPRLVRYRLSADEILAAAKAARVHGLCTIVLQSAEDPSYTTLDLCHIIERIKALDVAVTLSIGEKSYAEYRDFRAAGADRYLLRIETTDKALYARLDPNMDWQQRKDCLYALKDLGYEVGTGSMVGLPNQTPESIADDILFFKELQADMVGLGPFIPHPDTPLASAKGGSLQEALKVLALTRLALPLVNMPATTAMESLEAGGRAQALQSGANVIMPNFSPKELLGSYDLYPHKSCDELEIICAEILSLGRTVGEGKGQSKAYQLRMQMAGL